MARKLRNTRPCAPWGAIAASLIGTAVNAGTSLYGSYQQSKLAQQQLEEQEKNLRQQQKQINNSNIVSTLNNYFNSELYQEPDYYSYANGGRVENNRLRFKDGGIGIPYGHNLILAKGHTHDEINESGETGIGVQAGDKEFEIENNEFLHIKPRSINIISNRLRLPNGLTLAQAVALGANPNKIENYQKRLKRRLNIKDDPRFGTSPVKRSKAEWGARWTTPDYIGLGANLLGTALSRTWGNGRYNKLLSAYDNFKMPSYVSGSFVSGPTKFPLQDYQNAIIDRKFNTDLRNTYNNTASAVNARELGQELSSARTEEYNKVIAEAQKANFEARRENAKQYNDYLMQEAANRNKYEQSKAAINAELFKDKMAFAQGNITSTVGAMNSAAQSIGNFLQQGINNYDRDNLFAIEMAKADKGAFERALDLGYRPNGHIMDLMTRNAYNDYIADPSDTNRNIFNTRWNAYKTYYPKRTRRIIDRGLYSDV